MVAHARRLRRRRDELSQSPDDALEALAEAILGALEGVRHALRRARPPIPLRIIPALGVIQLRDSECFVCHDFFIMRSSGSMSMGCAKNSQRNPPRATYRI